MKFSITQTISPDVLDKLRLMNKIDVKLSDYLSDQLLRNNYGSGVESFIVGLNCINPKMLIPNKDFETGFIIEKKYAKAKKHLEFEAKLNHHELFVCSTEDEFVNIISKALLKSQSEIERMNIRDFDAGEFYADLKKLLQDRSWLKEPYQEKVFYYQSPQENQKKLSESEKMSVDVFWELVEKARVDSFGNFDKEIEIIINSVSKKEEKEIIGFELTLRELLIKANHYNVMAVQKIIEGSVNDDSFLYFRCKLILYGRITYENAINNPNYLFERIDPLVNGEFLLSVADRAFSLKFGDDTDKIFPRDYASEVIDYDFGNYRVQGKDWKESDLPKRYSKLWKAYH